MPNVVKRQEFLLPFARLFTRADGDVYDSILFKDSESYGDESFPALTAPVSWSEEAVAVMADAACKAVPADLRTCEENTVPSWLWRRQSKGSRRAEESDLRDIFNRIVGSAASKAWRLGLFTSERHARAFYDEARFALAQRHIAIQPNVVAQWGLDWAYGLDNSCEARNHGSSVQAKDICLHNSDIDALAGGLKSAASAKIWKRVFGSGKMTAKSVSLRLCDIATDWHSAAPNPARAAIDLMAMRHNDGSVNIDAIKQTARILTILLDLQERSDVTIGLANLSPLLMALGLAYDSEAARAMAASLAALVTAECSATSAEMAALRGMSDEFASGHEAALRSLRNHRRAVYGDGNDYEKLSVLPTPLPLNICPDLSLAAEAQRRWDEAVAKAKAFGMRAVQTTDLTPSPVLAVLLSCVSQGLEPMGSLTCLQSDTDGVHQHVLHPALGEALSRLGYGKEAVSSTRTHVVGTRSLRKAPVINASSLRARGLDDAALERIESYLPCVNSVALAITPWVLGVEFCRTRLKISARDLESPRFDLLKRFGFSDGDIKDANAYCYGRGSAMGAKAISLRHRPVFAHHEEVSAAARIRMAAAVQSFISGDTGVIARLPAANGLERGAETALVAWRSGLKSISVTFDPSMKEPVERKSVARRIRASSRPHTAPVLKSKGRISKTKTAVSAKGKTAAARRVYR